MFADPEIHFHEVGRATAPAAIGRHGGRPYCKIQGFQVSGVR